MNLVTIQTKDVLDILKKHGIYHACYSKCNYRNYYQKQYKKLSELCGFNYCPIFCAPASNDYAIEASDVYRSKKTIDIVKFYLNIPEGRCAQMEYYSWCDYIYYSSGCEYDEFFNYDESEALANISRYIDFKNIETPQVCIQEIKAADLIKTEFLTITNII